NVSFTATLGSGAVQFYVVPLAVEVQVGSVQGVATVDTSKSAAPPGSSSMKVSYPWLIQPTMSLTVFDTVNSMEPIQVLAINQTQPNTITAVFNNPHSGKVPLVLPGTLGAMPGTIMGNAGPQPRFDHRLNSALVPHYSIIK